MKIGDLIYERRKYLKLSQERLAKKCGVTGATISRWESGDIGEMKIDKINLLAKALHISPLVLLNENDSLTNDEHDVLFEYNKLSSDDKKIIKGMIKALNDKKIQ